MEKIIYYKFVLRSPKVDILKKNKNVHDKEEKIQLRVKVECEINNQNSTILEKNSTYKQKMLFNR